MASIVETRWGRISGAHSRGVHVFKGVRYARPPVGELRFRPPQAPEPWAGERRATRNGPVSVQASFPWLTFLNAGGARRSEDCLYLNVFTPGLDHGRRPVLVWIHGGGFLVGAGSTPIYDGRQLAEHGDIVVVSINYRLGALGYVHLVETCGGDLADASNLGVRDQIAALEWVRDNIERFGGDPRNVTVCGQSAGAMSVGALLAAPAARPLFQKAICMSGAAGHVMSRERAREVAEVFLEELDPPSHDAEGLGAVPVERILKAQGATNRRLANLEELMVMLPCVDGDVIPEAPERSIARGDASDIPLLIGTTLEEWKLFTPVDSGVPALGERQLVDRFERTLARVARRPPEAALAARQYREAVRVRGGRTSAFEVWSAFQSARVFHHPATRLARWQSDAGGGVYSYLFTWSPPVIGGTLGACHAIDIPFVFGVTRGTTMRALRGFAATATRLVSRTQDAWIHFARHGEPGHEGLPGWERWERETPATMILGAQCTIADGPLESEVRLLDGWL